MFILHSIRFPEATVGRREVENAWTGAGLPQPVPQLGSDRIEVERVRRLIHEVLERAGATPMDGNDGEMEVPDEAKTVLERLEEFYHRLFPSTRQAPSVHHFHYERLEWLGEF